MKRLMPLALAVAGANAVAQPLPMEHVLVSVPLHKQTAETAMPVTVLSGDALSRAAAATIGDTLNNAPGLANASFGPGVGQPVIRGQQGPRVTILQNGTSSADASNLSADHAVAVEALLAESIEVLRGPATLLYGGGAIGGVVNVVDNRIPTKPQQELTGGVEYRHDAAADMDTVVMRGDGGSGNLAFHLDGLYRDWNELEIPGGAGEEEALGDHGVIDNTDGRTRSVTAGGSYHLPSGFFGIAINRLENEYGIPAGAHEHHEDELSDGILPLAEDHSDHEEAGGVRIDMEQTRFDVALHLHEPLPGLEVVRSFVTYTDYQHREIEGSGEVGTIYSNDSWEGRLELVHEPVLGVHGVVGLQVKSGEFSALGAEAFIPVTESADTGLFVLEDYHLGAWTFETGLRLDWASRNPSGSPAPEQHFRALSASASALWDLAEQWQLGLALSRAERAPATEELYSNVQATGPQDWIVHAATDAIELGNPDLGTEVSNNADLSLHWDRGGHHVEVTLYFNDFSDYINLSNTGLERDGTQVLRYSQNDTRFAGIEIDSEFALGSLAGGQVLLGVFGDVIHGELEAGGDVPRLPPRRIGGRLQWSGDALQFWTRVISAADQDRPGINEAETAGYTRWDAGAEYRISPGASDLTLFVSLNNIGDEDIRLSTSFLRDVAPEAGRSIEAGIRFLL